MEKLKELREKTGAGISDCKKALDEAGGDMDKAVEVLRKKGIAKAAKRTGKEMAEGMIKVAADEAVKQGFIMEINTETDFAARSDRFVDFTERAFAALKASQAGSREELLQTPLENGTVGDELAGLSGVIGEKMDIKGCAVLKTGGTIASYSHLGGRIGVLVALDKAGEDELAKEIAMQVAAANPRYLEPAEVPAAELEKEKEIYREQLKAEGKPENMIDNILAGKLNKYYEEVCLLNQEYIKDDKKKVKDILGDVKVEKFIRYGL